MTAAPLPEQYRAPEIAARIALIAESFHRLLRRPLVAIGDDAVAALWAAPCAVVAHGTEPDPVFFFGNQFALAAFESDVAAFVAMPSRLAAEMPLRDERQRLLDRVARDGFVDDYASIRISASGRRFRIERTIIWNLVDAEGIRYGQAATFVL